MLQHGQCPTGHAEWWLRTAKIPDGDRSAYEFEVPAYVLEAMTMVDQLNAPSLTSAEVICRRMALIKEAHRVSPSSPDYSMADQYMGWGYRRGGATVNPQLNEMVATELRSQVMVAKEARKARKERRLRSDRGRGRGRGKGGRGANDDGIRPQDT